LCRASHIRQHPHHRPTPGVGGARLGRRTVRGVLAGLPAFEPAWDRGRRPPRLHSHPRVLRDPDHPRRRQDGYGRRVCQPADPGDRTLGRRIDAGHDPAFCRAVDFCGDVPRDRSAGAVRSQVMSERYGWRFGLVLAFSWAVLLFLALPIFVSAPISLTPERFLVLPKDGITLRNYVNLFTNPQWTSSIWQSLV